jgi:hypothetical protein
MTHYIKSIKNNQSLYITIGLITLTIIALWVWFSQIREYRDDVIADDMVTLSTIFNEIDRTCHIIGFDYPYNIINFLTVEKFYGSGVGSMNIEKPENWKGPYVEKNPSMQGLEYVVRRTHFGNFITPADGVTLSNGKTIGKDIIITSDSNISAMSKDPNLLLSKNGPLVAKIGEPPLIASMPGVIDQLLDINTLVE